MEILEAVKGGRSIRAFKAEDIPEKLFRNSWTQDDGHRRQGIFKPWEFITAHA